jgi:transposase
MWTATPIVLTKEEADELKAVVRAHKSPQRLVRRSRIVLLAAKGTSSCEISEKVGICEEYVAVWRQRYLDKRFAGLADAPRSGRPRRIGHDERIAIAAAATAAKDPDDPVSTWNCFELADKLRAEGIEVSATWLYRILKAMDIDLTRTRGWLNRRDDPEFWDRVRDVCGLYLSPPQDAIVLSVDEKTGIQAKQRLYADTPPAVGRPRRREFEYKRHGVASLVAALNVATGEILADTISRNDSDTFIGFLTTIESSVDPDMAIHVVLDNGASHTSKRTRAWFKDHPRWVVHYTPKHASWVNQVELFFSILQRKVIKNGNFKSQTDLIGKIIDFITTYDETSRPFRWTYAADPLRAA